MEVNTSLLQPPATVVQWKEIPILMKKMFWKQSPFEGGGELQISVPSGNWMKVFHPLANSLTNSLTSYSDTAFPNIQQLQSIFFFTLNAGYNTFQRLWFLSTIRSICCGFYILRGIVHVIYTPASYLIDCNIFNPYPFHKTWFGDFQYVTYTCA
jgi:hypothetical protein